MSPTKGEFVEEMGFQKIVTRQGGLICVGTTEGSQVCLSQ